MRRRPNGKWANPVKPQVPPASQQHLGETQAPRETRTKDVRVQLVAGRVLGSPEKIQDVQLNVNFKYITNNLIRVSMSRSEMYMGVMQFYLLNLTPLWGRGCRGGPQGCARGGFPRSPASRGEMRGGLPRRRRDDQRPPPRGGAILPESTDKEVDSGIYFPLNSFCKNKIILRNYKKELFQEHFSIPV